MLDCPTLFASVSSCLCSGLVVSLVPEFSTVRPESLEVCQVMGGITNVIFKVSVVDGLSKGLTVLVRKFGAEGVISSAARARENSIFAQLAAAELGPQLRGVFANGRVEQWLPARPISLDEMRDDDVQRGVAESMARLHCFCPAEVSESGNSTSLWESVANWLNIGRSLNLLHTECDIEAIEREVDCMRKFLTHDSVPSPLVFAHCDLLASNILVSTDGRRRISLIDFEYSAVCYRGFDIGNFFCEAMGGTTDGIVDASKYPSTRTQLLFCRAYLSVYGDDVSERAANALRTEANVYGLVAQLFWAAWGVAQSGTSTVDFPYLVFSRSRMAQYLATKDRYTSESAALKA